MRSKCPVEVAIGHELWEGYSWLQTAKWAKKHYKDINISFGYLKNVESSIRKVEKIMRMHNLG